LLRREVSQTNPHFSLSGFLSLPIGRATHVGRWSAPCVLDFRESAAVDRDILPTDVAAAVAKEKQQRRGQIIERGWPTLRIRRHIRHGVFDGKR